MKLSETLVKNFGPSKFKDKRVFFQFGRQKYVISGIISDGIKYYLERGGSTHDTETLRTRTPYVITKVEISRKILGTSVVFHMKDS